MPTTEERISILEIQQKNTNEKVNKIDNMVTEHSKWMNKTDITITEINGNVKAIKDIVTKLDARGEEKQKQEEKDIQEFKKKIFYRACEIIILIVLAALGIKQLM